MLWSVQQFPRQEGYAEVKGILSAPGNYGHLDACKRLLIVQDVLLVQPSSASDCK